MSTARVDSRHRIVIDKQTRSATKIKAGDIVVIEPIDDHSFNVKILDVTSEKIEEDPGWKAFHPPAKIKKYISPEELDKLMEETIWLE